MRIVATSAGDAVDGFWKEKHVCCHDRVVVVLAMFHLCRSRGGGKSSACGCGASTYRRCPTTGQLTAYMQVRSTRSRACAYSFAPIEQSSRNSCDSDACAWRAGRAPHPQAAGVVGAVRDWTAWALQMAGCAGPTCVMQERRAEPHAAHTKADGAHTPRSTLRCCLQTAAQIR